MFTEEEKKAEDHMTSQDANRDNKSQVTKDNNDDIGKDKDKADDGESKQGAHPPPREIVLKVHMHCEGCARKVRRCLIGFDGVEQVLTDSRANKVVVMGEKADPMKVMERVQRKGSHRHVELLSPLPKPNPPPPPPQEGDKPNPPEKKEEVVVRVVLKVHMHCEACSQGIKKRILRMKGVESVEPDLKRSQVSVKGVFEPAKLVEYVRKRTGKHAAIVEQEQEGKREQKPPREKKKEVEAGKEEKKEEAAAAAGEEGGKKEEEEEEKAGEEEGGGKQGKKEEEKEKEDEGGGESAAAATVEEELVEMMVGMELKKKENLYYPPYYMPRYVPMELLHGGSGQAYKHYHQYPYPPLATAYPPQTFSDDNPNACSIM